MEELLTIKQAAELMHVKVWTLRAWVSQKRIPYVKLGRLVRFDPKAINEFIAENSFKATGKTSSNTWRNLLKNKPL